MYKPFITTEPPLCLQGTLPVVASVEENDFVKSMAGGQAAWLGLSTQRSGR
jgi:hypothetical protein